MAYTPSYNQNRGYDRPPQTGATKPAYRKPEFKKPAPARKKEPVSITQTSKVQDMFLESMKSQDLEINIQMLSGKEHKGKISHFDRYIIILGPVRMPKVIYKSGIESIAVTSEIASQEAPKPENAI